MEQVINFVKENWLVILPVLMLIWSEFLALNPSFASNSIVQLINAIIKKLTGQNAK